MDGRSRNESKQSVVHSDGELRGLMYMALFQLEIAALSQPSKTKLLHGFVL